jgi:hypothetical protein
LHTTLKYLGRAWDEGSPVAPGHFATACTWGGELCAASACCSAEPRYDVHASCCLNPLAYRPISHKSAAWLTHYCSCPGLPSMLRQCRTVAGRLTCKAGLRQQPALPAPVARAGSITPIITPASLLRQHTSGGHRRDIGAFPLRSQQRRRLYKTLTDPHCRPEVHSQQLFFRKL